MAWAGLVGLVLDLDGLEADGAVDEAGVVGLGGCDAGDAGDVGRGADEVGSLDELELAVLKVQACAVEGAAFVGDEDDAFEAVDLDEELQLVDDPLLLEEGLGVAGEAGGAAGEGEAVVTREAEAVLEEVVEVLADPAVGAVDRRGVDAVVVVGDAALIGGGEDAGVVGAHRGECTEAGGWRGG